MRAWLFAVAMTATALTASCSDTSTTRSAPAPEPADPPNAVPTEVASAADDDSGLIHHSVPPDGEFPAADQDGVLVWQDDCLVLEPPLGGGPFLLLWPPGFRLVGAEILDGEDAVAAVIGEETLLGGGLIEGTAITASRSGLAPIPPACTGFEVWTVSEVGT